MARVVALVADLLFGSRVQSDLSAAGHQVELVGSPEQARARLEGADVLLVDLTDERLEGVRLVRSLAESRAGSNAEPAVAPRTLGYYAHVDVATREHAQRASFDLVVPRSRMAREGASLVSGLLGDSWFAREQIEDAGQAD